jgi:hypothetical protein
MEILVFKTNISDEADVIKVKVRMKGERRIKRLTVDREDCDKVLRIEADALQPGEIIELVKQAGYACEELTY